MGFIRKSKEYLIKLLSDIIRQLQQPNNKGHTRYALPYKRDVNNEITNIRKNKDMHVPDKDEPIHIVSSYVKKIKIKEKK